MDNNSELPSHDESPQSDSRLGLAWKATDIITDKIMRTKDISPQVAAELLAAYGAYIEETCFYAEKSKDQASDSPRELYAEWREQWAQAIMGVKNGDYSLLKTQTKGYAQNFRDRSRAQRGLNPIGKKLVELADIIPDHADPVTLPRSPLWKDPDIVNAVRPDLSAYQKFE